jgi:ubiquitin-activating enzyme E1 C
VLVVGAGGLGCEILKDLALSGVKNITVIDLDTIDISNLNRQFLFRMKDVGHSKAETAAAFIMKRVPGCKVAHYVGRIQDHGEDFYKQFDIIISGLDNIEARRWLNSMVVNLVEYTEDGEMDPSSIIPIIDGGTEGFKGQGRVIIPKVTACFECTLDSFPPQQAFPMCTIAETPRLPEHCIAYAYIMLWEKHFPDKTLDKDSPQDMQWVYEKALERANNYGIEGVTYFKTIGVVKNIIPAVASTNAVISAVCVNEAIKLLTYGSQTLNTYYMYMGSQGLYTPVFEYGKKDTCPVCCDEATVRNMTVSGALTLRQFMEILAENITIQLKKPSIVGESVSLYMQKPPSLELALRNNLDKPLSELLESGEVLTITDPTLLDVSLSIRLELTE